MAAQEQAVVEIARQWIGTPYCHQASVAGAGTDCLGLIRGVWRALYSDEPTQVPPYTRDWSEAGGDERLWRAAARFLRRKALTAEAPGDVLLFRMRRGAVAKHLGIAGRIGTQASVIHAYAGHAVVESPLTAAWRRKVVARFAFPALSNAPHHDTEEASTWQR